MFFSFIFSSTANTSLQLNFKLTPHTQAFTPSSEMLPSSSQLCSWRRE